VDAARRGAAIPPCAPEPGLCFAASGPSTRGRLVVVSLLKEFKQFLMRGNLVELAVAFVIGVVFAALIKSFIADLITPIIALIFGKPNFGGLSFTINSSRFLYGDFINALITFATTAAAIFFFVVKPYNVLMSRRAQEDPTVKACPECTSEIPIKARRCPMCTAELMAAESAPA
jgi:large conductance mechanosensitive channel